MHLRTDGTNLQLPEPGQINDLIAVADNPLAAMLL
jgi:hypothetical protein